MSHVTKLRGLLSKMERIAEQARSEAGKTHNEIWIKRAANVHRDIRGWHGWVSRADDIEQQKEKRS